jgi:hypothetical protein
MAIVRVARGKSWMGDILVTDPKNDEPYVPSWTVVPLGVRPDFDPRFVWDEPDPEFDIWRLLLWAALGFGLVMLIANVIEFPQIPF